MSLALLEMAVEQLAEENKGGNQFVVLCLHSNMDLRTARRSPSSNV